MHSRSFTINRRRLLGALGASALPAVAQPVLRVAFVYVGPVGEAVYRFLKTGEMKEKKVTEVILGTLDRFVAAQKFYLRNGFVEVNKNDLPSNFPAMRLDNRFFKKDLREIQIRDYTPAHQPSFERLNREWIEKYFWMEPVDFDVLQSPEEHIIKQGGSIIMAEFANEIAGTVALKRVSEKVFEFTKMAVDEKFRGKKVGQALAEAAIEKAKNKGADKIILYSNTLLAPAIALYKKIGFKEIPVDGPYKRSNIKMELPLK